MAKIQVNHLLPQISSPKILIITLKKLIIKCHTLSFKLSKNFTKIETNKSETAKETRNKFSGCLLNFRSTKTAPQTNTLPLNANKIKNVNRQKSKN